MLTNLISPLPPHKKEDADVDCSAVAEQRDEGEEEQPAEDGGEGAIKGGGGGVMEKGGDERIDHHMWPQFAHPFYLLAWVRRSPRCGVMGKHLGPPCGSQK